MVGLGLVQDSHICHSLVTDGLQVSGAKYYFPIKLNNGNEKETSTIAHHDELSHCMAWSIWQRELAAD